MKFRKKPVVIDAWQVNEILRCAAGGWHELPDTLKEDYELGNVVFTPEALYIKTLEGEMRADRGDWLIRGVKGEFYPCKPDIFEATYDPAD